MTSADVDTIVNIIKNKIAADRSITVAVLKEFVKGLFSKATGKIKYDDYSYTAAAMGSQTRPFIIDFLFYAGRNISINQRDTRRMYKINQNRGIIKFAGKMVTVAEGVAVVDDMNIKTIKFTQ